MHDKICNKAIYINIFIVYLYNLEHPILLLTTYTSTLPIPKICIFNLKIL